MDPITGAIAGNAIGSVVGGVFNAREASKSRKFQERMSRTQYQRAAADLEKAGLNRVLALGSPAPTPSGATASIESPQFGSTGVAAASAKQAIEQGKAQEALLKAQALETLERTRLTSAEAAKAEVEKGLYDALGPAANKVFEAFGSRASQAVSGEGDVIDNLVDMAKDRFLEVPRSAARRAESTWQAVKDTAGSWWKTFTDYVNEGRTQRSNQRRSRRGQN